MSYRELKPDPNLQQDIRCFWTLEETQADYNAKNITPDPFVELVINCGAPFVRRLTDGSEVEMPRVFLNTLQTKPLRMNALGPVRAICMRLYPWSTGALLDTRLSDANASFIALDNKPWQDIALAVERTFHRQGYTEAITLLQEFVSGIYHRNRQTISPLRQAGSLLFETDGQIRMRELAAHCYLSSSQLERRFKQLTQVTPKTYARIIRFRSIWERLVRNPDHDIITLAHDFGYTDQAHLTHDFKAFAEQTPTQFAAYARTTPQQWQDAEFLQDT